MRYLSVLFLVAGVVGCGQMSFPGTTSSRGGIAVVDLDKVAADTGRDQQLAQALELAKNSLNQSLAKTVEDAKGQLSEKKKAYGSSLSDDQQKEYSLLERSANTQLLEIKNKAQSDFERYRQNQIAKFRAELKPITQQIAAKRGLSVVIPKNEGLLLSVDPGVDITDDVVKVLKETRPVAQIAPPAPAPAASTTRNSASTKSAKSRTASLDDDDESAVR